ncbi:MAG TPA: 50S ribosomal protein L25/general stress protein Ctc [Phenylobacterium sp.]|uniref:50S ribosomal protein L25/general stress protein Ctc n=1 Tax=Phenylobacterium sp. TaxID=1871053 RepID=UPI002D4FF0E5|nr:50S ribosomal protein L25/general stress protein Ctc [Phenylobacterium sp.]HZZ69481.1 50S ribosomal protein L25/general stress protein Ctc [Phenylobacterium sp.]
MADIVLNVEVREQTGTGGARVTRREGLVPGVLYGGDKGPVPISVKMNEFKKALYTGKLLGHLVTLKYGSETQPVIAKAVDMHPVTDVPQHFDLYRVDANQQIKINVPLHFSHADEAPGIKRGGTLNVVFHDVQVSCAADHIPEELVVDLTGLDIGASIRVSDLKFPANVEAAVPADTVLATISGASSQADEDEAADAATSEGAAAEAAATPEEGGEA